MPACGSQFSPRSRRAAKKMLRKLTQHLRKTGLRRKQQTAGAPRARWESKWMHKSTKKRNIKKKEDQKPKLRTRHFRCDDKYKRATTWASLLDHDFAYTKSGVPDRRLKLWNGINIREDGTVDGRHLIPWVPIHSTKFNIRTRVLLPRQEHTHTLIFLHGFQRDGSDYTTRPYFFFDEEKFAYQGLKIVVPTAKYRPISFWSGHEATSWVDYWSDNNGEREDDICPQSVAESRKRIHSIIDREIQLLGDKAGKVFVGGTSQGAIMALESALSYPRVVGGVVACVGHLHSTTKVPARKRNLPIYLYNGLSDRIMSWPWVRKGYGRFDEAGYKNVHSYVMDGVGHHMADVEGVWIIDFLTHMIKKPKDGWKETR